MPDRKKRILCVEDHAESCELISFVLREFEIVSASTKAEAVELVKNTTFALVVLDYFLPDGTGEELCQHIRSFDQRTPILFVTASPAFSETRARAMGAQGSLRKGNPTFVDELRERAIELI